jgi:glyoxylase-like metal-dependent hydrolase (beta-lactamase superfamily II)
MRGQGRRVLKAVAAADVAPEEVALIGLTHWHIDHVGALDAVRRRMGAEVAAHRADAPVIAGLAPPTKPELQGESGKFARWMLLKLYRPSRVDRMLEDGQALRPGLRVVATPGHTPGHVCFYLEEPGILFAGDALFHRDGELQLPPDGFNQDSILARRSLMALRSLRFDQCYFGHGEPILGQADATVHAFLDRLLELEQTAAIPEGATRDGR